MVNLLTLDRKKKKMQHQPSIMYKFRQQSIKHNFRKFKQGRALFPFLREEYQSEAEDKHHVILNMAIRLHIMFSVIQGTRSAVLCQADVL